MSLDTQIAEHSTNVKTQSYSMSVSELVSMYRDGELRLHPEFQRFFRWTPEQKSRLIESLLLGIPVPPIFVSEREDAKWDVIDGLQRLSTILELMGELRDIQDKLKPPLQLTRTHYLPDLEGRYWEHDNDAFCLSDAAQIRIKRARLDVNIVHSTSDEDVKYEVFQRLNTGGAKATDQEVRNCLLVMTNLKYFQWTKELGEYPAFRDTLSLTDRSIEEAFDMELVSRYLIFTTKKPTDLQRIDELGAYLNYESVAQARDTDLPQKHIEDAFHKTFDFLAQNFRQDAFRRYNQDRDQYSGPMLVSLFEVIAAGLGYHISSGGVMPDPKVFIEKHRALWTELGSMPFVGTGVRASTRIPKTIQFGRKWIAR